MTRDGREELLRLVSDDEPVVTDTSSAEARLAGTSEAELLDAYSRAVIAVVEAVGSAVVGVARGERGSGEMGSGSGVVVAPDGFSRPGRSGSPCASCSCAGSSGSRSRRSRRKAEAPTDPFGLPGSPRRPYLAA